MADAELKIIRLSEIQAEPVEWTWEPYIPKGAIVLVQGDGGTGKTTMSLAIVAAITRGESILEGAGGFAAPANVIIQNAEDSYIHTIKPRLEQLGADCDRVVKIDEEEYSLNFLDSRIERTIIETQAALLVLDPVQAFFANANMNSANSVRPIMKHLGRVASRTGCSVLLVGHFHKRGGKAQYRGLGSVDIYAAARSVLTVGITDVDDNIRAVVHNKSNMAPPGASLAFGLDPASGFCWMGEYDITIDELLNGRKQAKPENQFSKARMFIENILQYGPVAATEIWEAAENNAIVETTLKRAKKEMGVHTFKRNNKWYWELPIEGECTERREEGQRVHSAAVTPLPLLSDSAKATG